MTFGGKVCLFKLQKGSKIDLLSKICIFSENIQKIKIFKRSKKNLTVLKMKQKPFSCSIGIWNYHLAPSKSESRIFLWPYASPLCKLFQIHMRGTFMKIIQCQLNFSSNSWWYCQWIHIPRKVILERFHIKNDKIEANDNLLSFWTNSWFSCHNVEHSTLMKCNYRPSFPYW